MNKPGKILYVDATAGAAGDMMLGALVHLGVPLAVIRRAVESLPLKGWKIRSKRLNRAGLDARKITVGITGGQANRGWREIRKIVEGGNLEPGVRRRALEIFRRLIEAEAQVHGVPAEKVHLHEAGGTDAIVDIVGACVGLAYLSPRRIVVSRLTTGFGTVRCRHGIYPVPAPATALLVRGVPVQAGRLEAERLTPTGAAILTTLADAWGPLPPMRPLAVGYGAGDLDLGDDPNLLRLILGEEEGVALHPSFGGEALVIEFNVDDAPPQVLAYATERLLEKGALEVHTAPVQMKKGRTGHQVTILARPADLDTLASVAIKETTTLGLRYRTEGRMELDRSMKKVGTPYGSVRVKVGRLNGHVVQSWPEYEDCAALARQQGVPLKEVQQAALEAYRGQNSKSRSRRREPK